MRPLLGRGPAVRCGGNGRGGGRRGGGEYWDVFVSGSGRGGSERLEGPDSDAVDCCLGGGGGDENRGGGEGEGGNGGGGGGWDELIEKILSSSVINLFLGQVKNCKRRWNCNESICEIFATVKGIFRLLKARKNVLF